MKTKILRNIFISVGVLFALTGLLAAGTRDGEGLVRAGNALPANIIVVTNTNDSGPGSLRNALAIANDDDTIDATSVSGTILLTSDELQISHSVTINGPGAGTLAINGNGTFHVFEIFDADVTISGFTITNGLGGITNENGTTTTVSNCSISGNLGGGISNVSGGLCCATLTVTNSTISGNTVAGDGGAIFNSTSDQHATLMITNSTISGNSATGNGGGIYNGGSAELELGSTILNAGGSGENIFNSGTATSLGYNLCSDNGGGYLTGPGDLINTDPMLGPLQDNGGPTFTHALLPGSPAINAGDPNFTPPPFYDQRGPGFDRVVNGRIDIGSFEVQAGATPTPTATATPTPTPTPTLTPTPTPRPSPTPRPRPTPHPRPTP